MRNILMKISFCGTAYHGFQIQPNAETVQGTVEKTIERITSEKTSVYGCSRTDAGVHANEFYLNFKTQSSIPCSNLLRAMNTYLPSDIAVKAVEEKDIEFHARYDTKEKEYLYLIYNGAVRDPFMEKRALYYSGKIDEDLLNSACSQFIGTHDFSAFSATGREYHTTVRTIKSCSFTRKGDLLEFKVCGDGFLYNMVRIMVGTLLEINEGKIPEDYIKIIIEKKERSLAGRTVSGDGLYLNRVVY